MGDNCFITDMDTDDDGGGGREKIEKLTNGVASSGEDSKPTADEKPPVPVKEEKEQTPGAESPVIKVKTEEVKVEDIKKEPKEEPIVNGYLEEPDNDNAVSRRKKYHQVCTCL